MKKNKKGFFDYVEDYSNLAHGYMMGTGMYLVSVGMVFTGVTTIILAGLLIVKRFNTVLKEIRGMK